MKVGFIGLGLMGEPMARNVLAKGHELVVWNRDPAAAVSLAADGAEVAESPADLGSRVDLICTCLPNGAIVRSALFGDDGALTSPGGVTTVVDHSTISRDDAVSLNADCRAMRVDFVDAPISGGPEGAAAGALAIFVGGEAAAVARATPVMTSYGSTIVHLGTSGAGQIGKLANQMIIATTILGIAEAFAYASAEGVDPQGLIQILEAATADSKMLCTRTPVPGLQPRMPASNGWRPGFTADFMAKDLRFAIDGAEALDIPVAGLLLVAELLDRAREAGRGSDDWTVFSQYL